MAVMQTYDLNGKKLSFANWISNLSPVETPFVSMTKKEAVTETKFSWQTDYLAKPRFHAVQEGSDVQNSEYSMFTTEVKDNYTQILRKVVSVTDTANLIASYGRGRELAYQLEKAGSAIKRDLEAIFLSNQVLNAGNATTARKTACFQALVAAKDAANPETGAIVHFESGASTLAIGDLEKMFYQLYIANSKANIIMFHPKHARVFANLQEEGGTNAKKLFSNDNETFSYYVNTLIDAFGREYKLVPNRFMPQDAVYFFNANDFTQMVLRAPNRVKLAKEGAFERWMIEMEVGLRLDNPYAAGVLKIKAGS